MAHSTALGPSRPRIKTPMPQTVPEGTPAPPAGGGMGEDPFASDGDTPTGAPVFRKGTDDNAVLNRFFAGTASNADLIALIDLGRITEGQAQDFVTKRDAPQAPDPLSGLYPYDPESGLVSGYPNESPIGSTAVEAGGPTNLYTDRGTGLLYNRKGSLLPEYLQKALGDALGGGGITAYQSAELARQKKQDEWDRVLDYITAAQNARALLDAQRQQRRANLVAAAPDLAGGMEFRGGFGPTSGYTILDRLQGGIGAPKSMGPSLVPLDLGPMPEDPGLVDKLLGPLR
jgi:hypothetical protein